MQKAHYYPSVSIGVTPKLKVQQYKNDLIIKAYKIVLTHSLN